MKIVNWNCRGFIEKRAEIQNLAGKYDIVSPLETFLKDKHSNININSFNHVRKDRPTDTYGGGLLVFIKQDIQYSRFYLQNCPVGLEYIALKIFKGTESLSVVSIYYPPNTVIDKTNFSQFFDEIADEGNFIITGDFNCQSGKWGSDIINDRGTKLEEILENKVGLSILNTGSATRFYKNSVPDISLSSTSIDHKIIWKTLDDPMGSDHFPIEITISDFHFRLLNERPRIQLSRVDWDMFSHILDSKVEGFAEINSTNYLEQYSTFVDYIYGSLKESNAKLPSTTHQVTKHLQQQYAGTQTVHVWLTNVDQPCHYARKISIKKLTVVM